MQTEASTKPPELGTQAHAARYSSDSEIHVAVTYGEQRPDDYDSGEQRKCILKRHFKQCRRSVVC